MPKPATPIPETEVKPEAKREKRTRRTFSPEYKLRMLSEADRCPHGERGGLLRREKLYSSQLQQWRREFAEEGVAGLSKTAPGPQGKQSPEQKEIERLQKENARLTRRLEIANGCLELQKKVLAMLDHVQTGSAP